MKTSHESFKSRPYMLHKKKHPQTNPKSGWQTGIYVHPLGYVLLSAEYTERYEYSWFRFIVGGVEHMFTYDKCYTLKGLARIAKRELEKAA